MTDSAAPSPRNIILRRICVIQVAVIVAGTLLLFVMMSREFGFFWHSFLLGGLGASIALQRKIAQKTQEELEYLAGDRIAISMPILYGAVMATVAYGLFMSNLVSGEASGGLLSSNVFPVFVVQKAPAEAQEETSDDTSPEETPAEETTPEETPSEVTSSTAVTNPESNEEELKPETGVDAGTEDESTPKPESASIDETKTEPQPASQTGSEPQPDSEAASKPTIRVAPGVTLESVSPSASEPGQGVRRGAHLG